MKTLAIDPGKTCGYSDSEGLYGQMTAGNFLMWLANNVNDYERIVIEQYVPRRWDQDSVRTVEVVGAIKWLARHLNVRFVLPADRQRTQKSVDTTRIRGRHARDAEACRLWDERYGRK